MKMKYVPKLWQISKITPFPKAKGDTNKILEHRPTALILVPAKIFESILRNKLDRK